MVKAEKEFIVHSLLRPVSKRAGALSKSIETIKAVKARDAEQALGKFMRGKFPPATLHLVKVFSDREHLESRRPPLWWAQQKTHFKGTRAKSS